MALGNSEEGIARAHPVCLVTRWCGVGAGGKTTRGLTRARVRVSAGGWSGAADTGDGITAGDACARVGGSDRAGRGASGAGDDTTTGLGAATAGEVTGIGRTTTGIGVDSTPRLGGGSARLAWRGASNCEGEAIAGFSSPTARASRVTGREGSTKALKVLDSPTARASSRAGPRGLCE